MSIDYHSVLDELCQQWRLYDIWYFGGNLSHLRQIQNIFTYDQMAANISVYHINIKWCKPKWNIVYDI